MALAPTKRVTTEAERPPAVIAACAGCPPLAAVSVWTAGVLAGRKYLAAGVWYGVTLPSAPHPAVDRLDLAALLAQSRPDVAYLRAIGSDAPALDAALRAATDRIAVGWDTLPVHLDRFRC